MYRMYLFQGQRRGRGDVHCLSPAHESTGSPICWMTSSNKIQHLLQKNDDFCPLKNLYQKERKLSICNKFATICSLRIVTEESECKRSMLKCSESKKMFREIRRRLETIRQDRTVWEKNRGTCFIPGGFLKFISLFFTPNNFLYYRDPN